MGKHYKKCVNPDPRLGMRSWASRMDRLLDDHKHGDIASSGKAARTLREMAAALDAAPVPLRPDPWRIGRPDPTTVAAVAKIPHDSERRQEPGFVLTAASLAAKGIPLTLEVWLSWTVQERDRAKAWATGKTDRKPWVVSRLSRPKRGKQHA